MLARLLLNIYFYFKYGHHCLLASSRASEIQHLKDDADQKRGLVSSKISSISSSGPLIRSLYRLLTCWTPLTIMWEQVLWSSKNNDDILEEPDIASSPTGVRTSHNDSWLLWKWRNPGRPICYMRYGSQLGSRTDGLENFILLLSPKWRPQIFQMSVLSM